MTENTPERGLVGPCDMMSTDAGDLNSIEQSDSQGSGASQPPTLRRALGLNIALAVVVGNVIGSGIFAKPGAIATDCGSFLLIISVWVLGGVLCILGALCFAELATMMPVAGGLYVYLRQAYGNLIAFLYAWTEFLFVKPASIGALAVIFVGSFALSINLTISPLALVTSACGVILLMTWINVIGVVWGGRVQLITTIIKVIFLALVALSPVLVAPFVGWTVHVEHYTTVTPVDSSFATQVAAVLLAVMWAYDGWHGVTPLSEEIQRPQRNIPLALIGGVGILILLYVAANVAYHGVLSIDEMRSAGDHVAEQMLYKLAGPVGRSAVSVVVMCSTFGAINSNLLLAPRITFALGRDGLFFRWLGQIHANYRTPVLAILTTSVMSVVLVASIAVAKAMTSQVNVDSLHWPLMQRFVSSLRDDSTFTLLTNFVIFSVSVFQFLAVLSLIILRIRQPDRPRQYMTWGYPFVPIVFLTTYGWFLVQIYLNSPLESRTGMGMILLGIPVYFGYRAFSSGRGEREIRP